MRRPVVPEPDLDSEDDDEAPRRTSFLKRVPRSVWVAVLGLVAVVELIVIVAQLSPGESPASARAPASAQVEDSSPPPAAPAPPIRPTLVETPRETAPEPASPPQPPPPPPPAREAPRTASTRTPPREPPPPRSVAPAEPAKVVAPAQARQPMSQQTVMGVVVKNKAAVVSCVNEQREDDPFQSGTLVMRWAVLPNGRTADVQAVTPDLRDTHLASCLNKLIKTWTFPPTGQRESVDFSFKF